MKKRLAEDFGIKHVEVRTFHSYGVRLLTKFKPDTPTDPPKQAEVGQEVKKILEDLLKNDRTFAKLVLDYAVEISDTTKEEADFEDETAYYEYLRQQEYVTLKGSEEVKSVAERDIANFLFINGVPYEYEPRARWAKSGKGRRSYKPDFELPGGIFIEHRCIDRAGNVPPWFDYSKSAEENSEEYKDRIVWSESQFNHQRERKLIQTYYYQWREGTLIEILEKELLRLGVELQELSIDEIIKRVNDMRALR